MNQVLQAHVFLFCLLSMILSPSWAVGEDWKLTFDQLSSHEMSFRIVVNADGKIAAFTKQRKSKEFEETSRSTITNDTVEDLRCRVIKLQQTLQTAELKKESARDVDIRYRVVYEHDGVEIETRWLAGQAGSSDAASETYLAILELLQSASGLDIKLRPDPFLKAKKCDTTKVESR